MMRSFGQKSFTKLIAITLIAVQVFAGIVGIKPSNAFAIGEGQQGGYQDQSNAAGQGGSTVDPTQVSWLQMNGCLFAGAGAALGTFINPALGVAAGTMVLSNADCQKVLVDKAKQLGGAVVEGAKIIGDATVGTIFKGFIELFGAIVSWLSSLMVAIIVFFADPNVFKFATNPFVHAGWYVCLQIANMLIVLGLIILANQFILGIEKFGNYKALMDYIIAALFLNFSLTLASMAIGVSNFLTLTFLNLTGAPTSANPQWDIPRNFGDRLSEVFQSIANMKDVTGGLGEIVAAFSSLILGLVVLILLAAIAFSFVKRVIFLWSYLILLPLAYVIGNLGTVKGSLGQFGGKGAWDDWMNRFTKELTFGPVMAFFLWLTLFALSGPMLSTAFNQQSTTLAETWQGIQNFIMPLMFIGFLGFGFMTANQAANNSFKWAQTGIDKVTKDLPAWTGRKVVGEPATKIGAQMLQSKAVQDIKAWGARNSGMPVLGGLWGRMSQGVSTLEERNKKPMQALVAQYAKTHNLAAVDDASILVNNIKAAMNPLVNDPAAVSANMERLKAVEKGMATLSADGGVDIGKLEKIMNRAGGELKTDDIYKLNPMRIDRTDPKGEGQKQFDGILEKATGDEWKKMAQASGSVDFAKAALHKIDSADKFMGMMKGYKGLADNAATLPAYQKMTKDFATSLATGKLDGAVGTMTTGHVKELLENPNLDKGFKNILLQKIQRTMDFKDKESLAKKPGLAKLINDRFKTLASRAAAKGITKGTSDGVDYFTNFTG